MVIAIPYVIASAICMLQLLIQSRCIYPLKLRVRGILKDKQTTRYNVHESLHLISAAQLIRGGLLVVAIGCVNYWPIGIPIAIIGLVITTLGCRMYLILKRQFAVQNHA